MHPVLRVAICLELLIAALHGFFFAAAVAEQYPVGATASIEVLAVPQSPDPAGQLLASAEEAQVPLARVSFESSPTGAQQRLSLTPLAESTINLTDSTRAFGFGPELRRATFTPDDEVTGRWVAFAAEGDVVAFVAQLRDQGFTVEAGVNDFSRQLQSLLQNSPLLWVDVAGLVAVFVAALVSSSRTTRVRAVARVFGARTSSTVVREAAGVAGFAALATAGALAGWWIVALVGWGGTDVFTGPGLSVVAPIVGAAAACILVSALASTIVAATVRRIVEQIAGRRPLGFVQVASSAALLLVIIGTFAGMSGVAGSAREFGSAIQSQQLWADEPDARSFALANTSEETIASALPGWGRVVADLERDDRTLLSYPQSPCSFRPDNGVCLFVDANYLERTEVRDRDGTRVESTDRVEVYLPSGLGGIDDAVLRSVTEWTEYQASLRTAESGTPVAVAETRIAGMLEEGSTLPVYSSQYLPGGSTIDDPLLIVVPHGLLSGDFTLAVASTGNLILFAPGDELSALVDAEGARPLVFAIDRPADLAAGLAIQARIALVRETLSLAASIALAFGLLVVLSAAYVERRRKQLFLGYLHGITFLGRHLGYFAFLTVIVTLSVLLSVAIGLGYRIDLVATRILVAATFLAALIPLLRLDERRFHADFLKRP